MAVVHRLERPVSPSRRLPVPSTGVRAVGDAVVGTTDRGEAVQRVVGNANDFIRSHLGPEMNPLRRRKPTELIGVREPVHTAVARGQQVAFGVEHEVEEVDMGEAAGGDVRSSELGSVGHLLPPRRSQSACVTSPHAAGVSRDEQARMARIGSHRELSLAARAEVVRRQVERRPCLAARCRVAVQQPHDLAADHDPGVENR